MNVEPVIVATIESLMSSVTSPDRPPPIKPVPAVILVISPANPDIVIAPFEAEEIVTLFPAMMNEVPSLSFVKEPLKPNDAVTIVVKSVSVVLLYVRPASPPNTPLSLN